MTRQHVFIIAEAGVNHNGELDLALSLIDAAADCGADCVKFQTFSAGQLAAIHASKADYQIATTGRGESQLEMLSRLEMPAAWYPQLLDRCNRQKILFLSSPFDVESLAFLSSDLMLDVIKLGSGELTNGPLLYAAGRTGKRLIISTGMGTLDEVGLALGAAACGSLDIAPSRSALVQVLSMPEAQQWLAGYVSLLHCVTEYPAPADEINLRAMDTIREAFGLRTGYSDHTNGTLVPIAAVARGAAIIEKHLTLDRTLPGPDHLASLEPPAMARMISSIREVEQVLGNGVKAPSKCEFKNISIARKSLVAAKAIKKGEIFSSENMTSKRPGTGRSPFDFWEILGTRASRNYAADDLIL